MKDIHLHIINFIEATDDFDDEFKRLIEILDGTEILQDQKEVRLLFQLMSKLADNHRRTSDIFDKFEKIFQYLIKDVPSPITYFIPEYTNFTNPIIFFFF